MCKIIPFPLKESCGFHNLTRLIEATKSLRELSSYGENAIALTKNGYLYPGETRKLTNAIQRKRLELTTPKN